MQRSINLQLMKRKISKIIDNMHLFINYHDDYFRYYRKTRPLIYRVLVDLGIYNITPVQKNQWKLWYNTSYYSGCCNIEGCKKRVFIKINGEYLSDCYYNEIVVNDYIRTNSKYLYDRLPKILFHKEVGEIKILVYEFIEFKEIPTILIKNHYDIVKKALAEYSRIGILHTDFGLVNIGISEQKYYFFDYGTSLCILSDSIRIRNSDNYNKINYAPSEALKLLPNAVFYYDDIRYLGIKNINMSSYNYLISDYKIAYAKLGSHIVQYRLQSRPNSKVLLLVKEAILN